MKKNNKGFTLMEMLIVVAIIAILAAIAIPTFGSSLTKARQAADNANVRATYAEAMTEALLNGQATTTKTTTMTMQAAYDGSTTIGDATITAWAKGDQVKVTVTYTDVSSATATSGTGTATVTIGPASSSSGGGSGSGT